MVVEVPEQFDFPGGPGPRRSGQRDAPPFALGDDCLDRAPGAEGKDGVRDLAQLGDLSACPRFWFSTRRGRRCVEYSQKRRAGSSRLSAGKAAFRGKFGEMLSIRRQGPGKHILHLRDEIGTPRAEIEAVSVTFPKETDDVRGKLAYPVCGVP